MQREALFNHQNRMDRMPSVAKKKLLKKKKAFVELLPKHWLDANYGYFGSVHVPWIEQVRKTRFELELINCVDCFIDGHGKYTTELVDFIYFELTI